MRNLLRQLVPAAVGLVAFTLLCGVVYPLVVTVVAQAFSDDAGGSIVERDGRAVGSELIGQPFVSPQYLHPRPSAGDYDGAASGGSNLAPASEELLAAVEQRVADYRAGNRLDDRIAVPVDAVTASGSGLDPHISVANARLQAPRVAAARGVDAAAVLAIIDESIDHPIFGALGEPAVNVLAANLALDDRLGASG